MPRKGDIRGYMGFDFENPPVYGVRSLGPNQTEVRHGDLTVLYSYETPVAFHDSRHTGEGRPFFVTDKFWSNATSRHISKWLREEWDATKKEATELGQDQVEEAATLGSYSYRNPMTRKGQRFVSGKIGTLVREGYPDGRGQAGAIAYREARRRGFKVPEPGKNYDPSTGDIPDADDLTVEVWEERDRLHIAVVDEMGEYIAEWWDDEARQMFEDGFFARGKGLESSVIEYVVEMGWAAESGD